MEPTPTDATPNSDTATDPVEGSPAAVNSTDATTEPSAASPGATADANADVFDELSRALEAPPPLALTAALTGLFAMFVARVLIPTRDVDGPPALWEMVARVGAFAINLSALASMTALVIGLFPWMRSGALVNTRRRLLIASFFGMLLPVWIRALFSGRESMTGALAGLGAATAYSLAISLLFEAMRSVPGRRRIPTLHVLPAIFASVCTLSCLALITLQSLAVLAPLNPAHRFTWLVSDLGEAAYLALLLSAVTSIPTPIQGLRARAAAVAGGVVALLVGVAFALGQTRLGKDFAVALYYAQHVTWFLAPSTVWIYGLPFALGLGAAVTASLNADRITRQLGVAILAWTAAGFAPRAPWRFVLLAMGACLLARAILARKRSAPSA